VVETLDAFRETDLRICNEILIEIHHHLLVSPEATAGGGELELEAIYSHPQVFYQCSQWLAAQHLDAQRIRVESTAAAARIASENPKVAAIASRFAGDRYGLTAVVSNIEDNSNNATRFFVVAREPAQPTGDDKTAVMFTAAHKPGSLVSVLDVFRKHGVNLTHIDKRPLQKTNWEYYFFVDCEGHQQDEHVARALDEAATHCHHLTVLGSFPRASEPLD
jgi:chorismate mutase/prephenate dehydratase